MSEEMRKLLGALQSGLTDGWSPEAREAWVVWKDDVIRRVENLDRRERELQSEPYLWISHNMLDEHGVWIFEQAERGTPSEVP